MAHSRLPGQLAGAIGLLALAGLIVGQQAHPEWRAAPDEHQDTYHLRLLTWNVGRIYLPFDSRASDEDLAHIAEVVRASRPDVVALQELRDAAQVVRLQGMLGGEFEGRVPDTEVNDRRVAILARRQQRGVRFRSLVTSTGRSAEAVSLPLDRKMRALVVSIHLDAFNRDQRRVQAEEIVDWANRQPESDIFLAGDFNFDYDFLAGQDREHPDLRLYRLLTRNFEDLGRGLGGTTILARRIDYIFARTSGVEQREVTVVPGGRIKLMDHEPVLGVFDIRRPTRAARR